MLLSVRSLSDILAYPHRSGEYFAVSLINAAEFFYGSCVIIHAKITKTVSLSVVSPAVADNKQRG